MNITDEARAHRRELLIDLCCEFVQDGPFDLDLSPPKELERGSWVSHFIDGIASIQIFPMTEPRDIFPIDDYSVSEALQRDWAAVGHDLCQAIVKDLREEINVLAVDQSNVESSERARAKLEVR